MDAHDTENEMNDNIRIESEKDCEGRTVWYVRRWTSMGWDSYGPRFYSKAAAVKAAKAEALNPIR